MSKRNYGPLLLALVAGFILLLGSCDLFLTAYTIQVRLGHQNPDDPNRVTFTLSDLPPKSLEYTGWFPSGDSFYEYTARLKKASDFTIVVETSDGTLYTQKIPVQEGYRYSIYYQNVPAYNYIFSYEESE
jgi:hypothetical protein